MTTEAQPTLRLRILVLSPPAGAHFAVQRGSTELLPPPVAKAPKGQLRFEFTLRLGPPQPDGSFNFLGEYSQGPRADRFVYLNSGSYAAETGSTTGRRAKIKLAGIPVEMVEAALADEHAVIEARVLGTMADGGPICATVKPRAISWTLIPGT